MSSAQLSLKMIACLAGILGVLAVSATPSFACRVRGRLDLTMVARADVVVVGHIVDYELVPDLETRIDRQQRYRQSYLTNPEIPQESRDAMARVWERDTFPGGDWARFTIEVREVLAGESPPRLRVAWTNGTYGLPEQMEPGPYVIALWQTGYPEPELLTVVQELCSPSFILEYGSVEAQVVGQLVQEYAQ